MSTCPGLVISHTNTGILLLTQRYIRSRLGTNSENILLCYSIFVTLLYCVHFCVIINIPCGDGSNPVGDLV